jgi:hypothetical protein
MTDTLHQPDSETQEAAAPRADDPFTFDAEPEPDAADPSRTATTREWMNQLQSMIDNVATHAAPAMRDIAAKAAELAALAGEKAGPIARRAADATAEAGTKLAERGRVVAADLRREAAAAREATNGSSDSTDEPKTASATDVAPATEDEREPAGTGA